MGDSAQGTGKKELTAADAAKAVRRPVTKVITEEDGTQVTKTELVAVQAKEVLSFRDYGDKIVVVTKDGKKFSSVAGE